MNEIRFESYHMMNSRLHRIVRWSGIYRFGHEQSPFAHEHDLFAHPIQLSQTEI